MPASPLRSGFALALLVPAFALSGCRKPRPAHTIGLALDVGGRGDQSFNDGALRGLEAMAAGLKYTAQGYQPIPDAEYQELLPADLRGLPGGVPHLGLPAPLILSGKAQEDYEPNLQLLVDQGAELVVAVGFMMEPATRAVAARNPKAKFLLLDSPVLDDAGRHPTTRPNVRAVVFREQEGSFLAGALAGELTRTGRVGFVGGMQLPLIKKFEAGFRAGLSTTNPAAAKEVAVAYTGSFDDEKKGVEVGRDLYARGCDIVFHAAGLDGLGVIKAAQGAGKLVIGVDSDQAHVAPQNVLTSMVKHVDYAVYEAARDVLSGKFSGGDVVLGLKEGGVGLTQLGGGADRAMPKALRDAAFTDVQLLRAAVVDGRVAVPATLEELQRFAAPAPRALGLTHAAAQ
ncbi:MAG: BMP family ABC transporter substrate-binding protein [Myxococcales bacterium]